MEIPMVTTNVRAAAGHEEAVVIGVITLAFSTDPMARWAFPDPAKYLDLMPRLARAFGGNAFGQGSAHLVEGGHGAAMWLPPGLEPDVETLMQMSREHVPNERQDDMMRVFEQMDAFHPTEPCWYLPMIGVDPACQGRGYGSALLRFALEQVDRAGAPAYLESSNPRNIPLYERHGFAVVGNIQAGTSPSLAPMLRPPRSGRT
jgi:ribosomal protein S18 acetylase RimI-like enzyme